MNTFSFFKGAYMAAKTFTRAHVRAVVIALVSILISVGAVAAYEINNEEEVSTVLIKKGTIVETVSVTGKVKPAESVDLSFDSTGRVAYVFGDVGNEVRAGQTLAYLSGGEQLADLEQAKAVLRSEEARLAEMARGSKPEEVSLQELAVKNAELSLQNEREDVGNSIREAYYLADDAVRSKSYQFFNSPEAYNATLKLSVESYDEAKDIEDLRRESSEALNAFQDLVNSEKLYENTAKVKEYLYLIQRYLDKLAVPVNELSTADGYSASTVSSYKLDIYTARNNIASAISSVSSSEQSMKSADSSLALEKQALSVKMSGSSLGDLDVQRAIVEKARAMVTRGSSELSKKSIVSPINGIITKQNIKKGESAGPGASAVSVMANSNFEIEVYVPEADIESVTVGDEASVTLDAYNSDTIFTAKVSSIDPAETVIQGVSAYRAILQFDKKDDRIRSGMTANVEIAALSKDGAMIVPSRAISYREDGEYVSIYSGDEAPIEIKIQTGIRSDDGETEIIGDVSEGAVLVMPE